MALVPSLEPQQSADTTATRTAHAPPSVIAACMTIGTVSMLILGLQPALYGALVEEHRLTDTQLGPIATAELLTFALGASIGPMILVRGRLRTLTAFFSLSMALLNPAIFLMRSALAIATLRGLCGFAEGMLMAAAIVITTNDRYPDRLTALMLGISTIPQAILAYLIPRFVIPQYGSTGGFAIVGLFSIFGIVAAYWMRPPTMIQVHQRHAGSRWNVPVVLAVSAILLQSVAIGAGWEYVQRLGDFHQFSSRITGLAVSGALVFQVIVVFAVAAWGRKLDYHWALILGTLGQAAVVVTLALVATTLPYLIGVFLFGAMWLALNPFQVLLLIEVDPSRRIAMQQTGLNLVALSIGPAIGALGVRDTDVRGAYWIAAAILVASGIMFMWARSHRRVLTM